MRPEEKALLFDQIRLHGECTIAVGGYCMSTTIPHGSEITIGKSIALKKGEIAAYFIDNQLFVHRVIELLDTGFRARADGSNGPDAHTVANNELLGTVTRIQRPSLVRRLLTQAGRIGSAMIRRIPRRAPPS